MAVVALPSLSAVVPVYRSRDTLHALSEALIRILPSIAEYWEILLVEDGGGDGSWDVIRELAVKDSRVRGIALMRNYGQHNALLAGIRAARYDVIITLDDDLQNPPEEIPKLLAMMDQGYDVVYGWPDKGQHGLFRDLASTVTKIALSGAMGAETARRISAFRAFRTRLREAFRDYRSPHVSLDVLLSWGTSRFCAVPVRREPRKTGESGYTLPRLVRYALDMITGFTGWPLRLTAWAGLAICATGGAGLAILTLRGFLSAAPLNPIPFLSAVVALFAGIILLALGVSGEYLARIHARLLERPPYAIRDQTFPREG